MNSIHNILSELSLQDKINQLFIVSLEELDGGAGNFNMHPGGIILFERDLDNWNLNYEELLKKYRLHGIEPLISVDEEGGRISRVNNKYNLLDIHSPYYYKEYEPEVTKYYTREIAKMLKSYHINTDYAPCADLYDKECTTIKDRAYSEDPQLCSILVSAAVNGFHKENVMTCIKHFPGHGRVLSDSHKRQSYLLKDFKSICKEELIPFIGGIRADTDMVMCGHIIVPTVDDFPASLSDKWVRILRNECQFRGCVITDSLRMKGVLGFFPPEEIALRALRAGNDIVLLPPKGFYNESIDVVANAVRKGFLSETEIDLKLTRVLSMKARYGLLSNL